MEAKSILLGGAARRENQRVCDEQFPEINQLEQPPGPGKTPDFSQYIKSLKKRKEFLVIFCDKIRIICYN